MALSIPEGFAFVARGDRSRREAATELLARAEEQGVDPTLIRSTTDGYYIPEELLTKDEQSAAAAIADAVNAREANVTRSTAEATAVAEAEGDDRPALNAKKADWVDFAKTQGYDESEELTKDELIERYGG